MSRVVVDDTKLIGIADEIRKYGKIEDKLTLAAMKNKIQSVAFEGYKDGISEGWRQAGESASISRNILEQCLYGEAKPNENPEQSDSELNLLRDDVLANTYYWNDVEYKIKSYGVDIPKGTSKSEYSGKIAEVHEKGLITGHNTGYNEGLAYGIEEGQKTVFERIQDFGKTQNYYYAFAYDRFDDTNFFPPYPIKCSSGTTPGRYIFYNATGLTDTKVEIVANSNNIDYAFYDAGLVIIRKLTVYETTKFNNTFYGLDNLEEINMDGTIGSAFDIHWSTKLNKASQISIITHLSETTSGVTVAFSKKAVNNAFGIDIDDPTTYPEGSEWYELRNSRSNWTFNFS